MSDSDMTFWDHFDALRSVLVRIAVVIFALGVGSFIVMPWFFDHVVLAPCNGDFPLYRLLDMLAGSSLIEGIGRSSDFSVDLVSMQLTSQFFIHMSASCWMACIIGFPIIIYLLWTFVEPALYENEKRNARRAFFFGNLMFYLGVAAGYFLVFPLAVRFLAEYSLSDRITGLVSLDSYMDNFFTVILLMGAVFELPLLCWLLGKTSLMRRSFFKNYRRHAIVSLLIVAAIITPTGDPFSLFAVFLPIYGLWELSARLVPADTNDDSSAIAD